MAKNVFQVHGVDRSEDVIWRKKLGRDEWLKTLLAKIEPGCEIGMEACGGAHHWARQLQRHGYAEAICEAMSRRNMRFVTVKTIEQQDVQAVHRIRAELSSRVAKANQIRGLASEYGLTAARELLQLRVAIPYWLEDASNGLTDRFRRLLAVLLQDLLGLDERIKELDREIICIAQTDPVARRLQQLRVVGPIIATAIVANVGDATRFANGRQMAASFGLTPRQNSSGGKERLLGVSKRGDAYLRTLFIHGARSMIRTAKAKDEHLSQ